MERMIIKHLSGSKANQTEEFALRHHNNLIFGRDTTATVKYDPDRDDLVGREHARIELDPNNQNSFLITDLNSRNGTYLNNRRISGTTRLSPGDEVQFGPGGPKFQFDVEPRPATHAPKSTRIAESASPTPMTRVVDTTGGASMPTGKATVGKATVERMISSNVEETRKQERGNFAKIGIAAAVAVLFLFGAVIAGAYLYNSSQKKDLENQMAAQNEDATRKNEELKSQLEKEKASAPKAASEIAEKYSSAVVQIEASWRLLNPTEKSQVYHRFVPTQLVAAIAKKMNQNYSTNAVAVPLYVQTGNGNNYEPVLVDDKSGFVQPIGGTHSGTGFIVTSDGYILTNRHVAATWMTSYVFPEDTPPGVVLSQDGNIISINAPPPPKWVPANTKKMSGMLNVFNMRIQSPADYTGVNDILKVSFPGKDRRMNVSLIEPSDRHDVAMMKVDKPGETTKVELFDNYDELKKGEELVIVGYPAMTASQYGVIQSSDMFNDTAQIKTIPNPTVTLTSVSNILRNSKKTDENVVISEIGDVIQLATGSTGGGNSGGPVFDTQGRVIGIFFAGSKNNDIRYAVPIRYGKELMD